MNELDALNEFITECPMGMFTDSDGESWKVLFDFNEDNSITLWLEKYE